MSVVIIVKGPIRPGRKDALQGAVTALQSASWKEDGCEQYEAFYAGEVFLLLERWRSRELLEAHQRSAHFRQYVPLLKACLDARQSKVQIIHSDEIELGSL